MTARAIVLLCALALVAGCGTFDPGEARREQTETFTETLQERHAALPDRPLSLEDCVRVAVSNNYAVRLADLDRELAYPDDSLKLYYNPNGGENYHSQETCTLVKDKYEPMTAFTYGQLNEKPFSKLNACPGCAPMPRKNKIDELNQKSRKSK